MKTFLTRNGYIINKKDLSKEQIERIRNDLLMKPFNNMIDDVIPFSILNETKNRITIPRFYGIKHFGFPTVITMKSKKIKVNFKGSLRENQVDIVNKSIDYITKNNGGILSLPCGFGKTTISLYILCQLKLKTLVLVHKTFLLDQWIERIKTFTNATVGIIQRNKINVNADIVVGMIDSISMRDYDDDIFKHFGFVIYDEVHHLGSRVFSKTLQKTGAQYMLGLSATPYRSDGLTKILYWYIGEIFHKTTTAKNKKVYVKFINYKTKNSLFVEKKRWFKDGIKPNIPVMISNLTKIPERTNHLVDIIYTLLTVCPDRKIIILSDRIQHLKDMKIEVDKKIELDVKNGLKDENECKTFFYIGEMKQKERKEAETEGDILFASFSMAKEALDIERLNTVIFTTPQKDVIQAMGRIMRKNSYDTGIRPLIIDFVDEIPSFSRHRNKREKIYLKCDYKIFNYYVFQSNIITKSQNEEIKFSHKKIFEDDYEPKWDFIFKEIDDIDDYKEEKNEKEIENVIKYDRNDFKEYLFDI